MQEKRKAERLVRETRIQQAENLARMDRMPEGKLVRNAKISLREAAIREGRDASADEREFEQEVEQKQRIRKYNEMMEREGLNPLEPPAGREMEDVMPLIQSPTEFEQGTVPVTLRSRAHIRNLPSAVALEQFSDRVDEPEVVPSHTLAELRGGLRIGRATDRDHTLAAGDTGGAAGSSGHVIPRGVQDTPLEEAWWNSEAVTGDLSGSNPAGSSVAPKGVEELGPKVHTSA